ncbi:hypothetical protein DUI87_09445 [Hirundo rustica rustica]|uniref:Uncharacterized protein n=1 Tax=Hirundo rustica rustica TaxID=333673 RepID=A0A3M0KNY0_HIRRU|nr:hypothetical protein DUI87_09445 [Hirundo rustica rustica]
MRANRVSLAAMERGKKDKGPCVLESRDSMSEKGCLGSSTSLLLMTVVPAEISRDNSLRDCLTVELRGVRTLLQRVRQNTWKAKPERKCQGRKFFTSRMVRNWNRLPRDVEAASSQEVFMAQLDEAMPMATYDSKIPQGEPNQHTQPAKCNAQDEEGGEEQDREWIRTRIRRGEIVLDKEMVPMGEGGFRPQRGKTLLPWEVGVVALGSLWRGTLLKRVMLTDLSAVEFSMYQQWSAG